MQLFKALFLTIDIVTKSLATNNAVETVVITTTIATSGSIDSKKQTFTYIGCSSLITVLTPTNLKIFTDAKIPIGNGNSDCYYIFYWVI